MIHFIRLLRPVNLIIVGLTMYGLGWFLEFFTNQPNEIQSINFFLLVLSTVMIAGAGNIINDYFDVKADRINKPDKLIIGKHVKRRVAIISHWIINFLAFLIALYLSWTFNTFWYLFIHLLAINFLWFYSTYLKRRFIFGNLIVASLTGLVPILVGFYFYHLLSGNQIELDNTNYSEFNLIIGQLKLIVGGLAFFAFILNLAREIIKDIEDVEGDKLLHSRSVPITLGVAKTKIIVYLLILTGIISLIGVLSYYKDIALSHLPFAFGSIVLMSIAIPIIITAKDKSRYKLADLCLKLAMIFGLLIPVYLRLLEGI